MISLKSPYIDNLNLVQLREVKPSLVSFRTIRYSKKEYMKNIAIEYYPNRESRETIYLNRLGGESFLEDTLMVLQEHEPNILLYLPQSIPVTGKKLGKKLEYIRKDGIIEEWTPDNASLWIEQKPKIIEVKSIEWINSLSSKEKKKLFYKWDQAKEFADKHGFEFQIFTDEFINQSWRVENIRDLESQMRFSEKEHEEIIIEFIYNNRDKNLTVKKLQRELELKSISKQEITKAICSLIYRQKIYIDLEKEFRFDKTILKIPNENLYEIPLNKWLDLYKFQWNSKDTEIKSCKEDFGIINRSNLTEYQKNIEIKNRDIIQAIENGDYYKNIIRKFKISYGKFHNLKILYLKFLSKEISEKEFQRALIPQKPSGRRKTRLFDVDKYGKAIFYDLRFKDAIEICIEKQNRLNYTDAWRFYKRFKRLDAFQQGLTTKTSELLSVLLEISKINPNFKHTTANIFRNEIKRYCQHFYKRVITKREGLKQAMKESMIITGATPYTNYIGQMVQIDHTLTDIINKVALPITIFIENQKLIRKKKNKRYYMDRTSITVLEDVHTGVILGYAFRYRKPSIESDFQAIRRMVVGNVNPLINAIDSNKEIITAEKNYSSTIGKILRGIQEMVVMDILPKEEYEMIQLEFDPNYKDNLRAIADWWDHIRVIPYLLHMDNGRDFTSIQMKKWMAKNHINTAYRPVGGSQYGGHVERLLGTLNRQAFHEMTGTTKSNPNKRGGYSSEKFAILTFEQLEALLLLAIIRYHASPHNKDNLSPREKWRQAYEDNGHNFHFLPSGKIKELTSRMKNQIHQLAWDLMPEKKIIYNLKDGLTINKIKYNDIKLANYLRDKQKVRIRYSNSDIRFVWWWNSHEDRPIPIWAKKIKLGDRVYNKNQLQRIPIISNLQFQDMQNLPLWKMGMELSDEYERIVNSAENVHYSIYKNIPKSLKEIKKIDANIAKKIDEGRIEAKEMKELNQYLDFENANQSNNRITINHNLKKLNKKDQKKELKKLWQQKPVIVKNIIIPPKKTNPFTNKKINLKDINKQKNSDLNG